MAESEKIRVLIVDDDQGDFEMARSLIEAIENPSMDFDVEWISSYEEALDAFDDERYDVYIVDYFLEDYDGLDLVREARRRGIREPVIMLTGRGSYEVDVEAMKAGASDYLVKGKIDPDLMERTIRYALERLRSETALRDSEKRHRSMFDHLPIGLYRVSPEGEFMDANPALVRILGYPDPETLQKRHASSLYVSPKDRSRFESLLEQYGVARGFETTLELQDGSTVRVRNTARAHRGGDGRIQYIEGAVEDIAEERWTEQLRGSADRFDAIYQRSAVPILLVDPDGSLLEGNTAFLRTFGYSNARIRGMPFPKLAAVSDRDDMEADLRTILRGDVRELDCERRFNGGDGIVLWARVRGTAIRDSAGELDHILVLLENVAESGETVEEA